MTLALVTSHIKMSLSSPQEMKDWLSLDLHSHATHSFYMETSFTELL